MKKIAIVFFCLSFGSSAFAAAPTIYKCHSEAGNGNDVLEFDIDHDERASLFVNESDVGALQYMEFYEEGNIDEREGGILQVKINVGRSDEGIVSLSRGKNQNQLILDIEDLNLGLSDTRYICVK